MPLVLVIWQPRGLGIGWSAMGGAVLALLTGVISWGDVPMVWHIVCDATFMLTSRHLKDGMRQLRPIKCR